VHAQRAVGYSAPGGSAAGGATMGGGMDEGVRKAPFLPDLKAGQLPGQQLLRVSAWSVEDVAKWLQVGPFVLCGVILDVLQRVVVCFDALCCGIQHCSEVMSCPPSTPFPDSCILSSCVQTLSLGQYSEAFIDSAVDGEFLYDLNDDDLKNTLGIEHRLHRKKILNCVHRLKLAEAQKDNKLNELLRESGNLEAPVSPCAVDVVVRSGLLGVVVGLCRVFARLSRTVVRSSLYLPSGFPLLPYVFSV
jgi:hypothetical protein